jgi:uncharacterized protein (TIGR02147 family)
MIEIFSFTDYREFLRTYYAEQKKLRPHFSYRFFSRMAGLKGNNYLQMVMAGKRNLTPTSISKFTKALKFDKREAGYFENLVLFNQAKSDKEKDLYFERLITLKPELKITGLGKDEFEYLTRKHYVIIREMVALPHFEEDYEWIGSQLNPPLRAKETESVVNKLLRLGLLKRNEEGKLKTARGPVITPPDAESLEIFNYHRQILSEAKDAIVTVPYKLREFVSLTIPMSLNDIDEIKNKIRKCQEDIAQYINKGGKKYDDVFQVNIQLFPATHTRKNKEPW